MFTVNTKMILDSIENINASIPAVNVTDDDTKFMFYNKVNNIFKEVALFVQNEKEKNGLSKVLNNDEIMSIVSACNTYFIAFINKKTKFMEIDINDNDKNNKDKKFHNVIFLAIDDYFNIFVDVFMPYLKEDKDLYELLRNMYYLKTMFPIAHDELYNCKIFTKIMKKNTNIEMVGNIKQALKNFVEGTDYIKIENNEHDYYKPNIHYLPVDVKRKSTYYLSNNCFKSLAMLSLNTDKYRQYFILTEFVFTVYRDYSNQVKEKIIECGKIEFNQTIQEKNNEIEKYKMKAENYKEKYDNSYNDYCEVNERNIELENEVEQLEDNLLQVEDYDTIRQERNDLRYDNENYVNEIKMLKDKLNNRTNQRDKYKEELKTEQKKYSELKKLKTNSEQVEALELENREREVFYKQHLKEYEKIKNERDEFEFQIKNAPSYDDHEQLKDENFGLQNQLFAAQKLIKQLKDDMAEMIK